MKSLDEVSEILVVVITIVGEEVTTRVTLKHLHHAANLVPHRLLHRPQATLVVVCHKEGHRDIFDLRQIVQLGLLGAVPEGLTVPLETIHLQVLDLLVCDFERHAFSHLADLTCDLCGNEFETENLSHLASCQIPSRATSFPNSSICKRLLGVAIPPGLSAVLVDRTRLNQSQLVSALFEPLIVICHCGKNGLGAGTLSIDDRLLAALGVNEIQSSPYILAIVLDRDVPVVSIVSTLGFVL